jgi:hypothetical protein
MKAAWTSETMRRRKRHPRRWKYKTKTAKRPDRPIIMRHGNPV